VPVITWNLYNSSGVSQLTQFAQASTVSANSQDGLASSQLTQVGISDGGSVVATFSDGQQLTVGQLAMAAIVNPDSLVSAGNNNYQLSSASSLPAIGVPNTGGRGQILGGSIEASNVDIATEFTNLIVYQRAYEANSKVVTTTDQLSQDTIALIR
jgi:flagellar hook protein FlgE